MTLPAFTHCTLRSLSALAVVGSVAACAIGPSTSYVSQFPSANDGRVIAMGIGEYLGSRFPATSTTIILYPTAANQAANELTPLLTADLQHRGFAMASSASSAAHTLRYWVTPLDSSGELVRLTIDGREVASAFYARNTVGNLQAYGPFTVMQKEASR
jgi:hypothetical protein